MGEIVDEHARPRSDEISEHREVRSEKQQCEERPARAGVAVERDSGCKRGRALEAQNRPHATRCRPGGGSRGRLNRREIRQARIFILTYYTFSFGRRGPLFPVFAPAIPASPSNSRTPATRISPAATPTLRCAWSARPRAGSSRAGSAYAHCALAALLSASAEVSGEKPSAARPSEGQLLVVAGERSHCRYANLSSYFVIPNLTPPAA